MASVYVGNLDPKTTTRFIELELQIYGEILSVKIPRSSSLRRYAFVEFKHRRDAQFAIHSWNSKFNWRLELSRNSIYLSNSINSRKTGFGANNCYTCGRSGHFARNCPHYSKDIKNKGGKQSERGRTKNHPVASASTWEPISPPPPPWLELPEDIMVKILRKLGAVELLKNASKVCTAWRKICRDPTMWRVIDMWKLGVDDYEEPHGCGEGLCLLAVDLSQGKVTEINIEDFGSDYLLDYIRERCGHLRCLRFAFCYDLSFEILSEAKGFPLLEELHLHCTPIENFGIEAIGQSCPMLKKFALNGHARASKFGIRENNREALAVATSMPELRHLQLFGNGMTNDALEAILNGCPKLESLDLRHCFNLNFEGELAKRCTQQIKNLRRPNDPADDDEWHGKVPYWAAFVGGYFSDQDSCYDYDYVDLDYGDLDYEDYIVPYQFDGRIIF